MIDAGMATKVSGKSVGIPELEDVEVIGDDCMCVRGKSACAFGQKLCTDPVTEGSCVEVACWVVVAEVHDERTAHGGEGLGRVRDEDADDRGDEFRRWVLDLGSVLVLGEDRMTGCV